MTLPTVHFDRSALAMPGATASEIAAAVSRMLASFPAANVSPDDAKIRLENYAAAFGATPFEAIRIAARNLLAGTVDGYDGRFAPTPPQWAKEARRVHHAMLATQPQKALPPPEKPKSAEERAKVAQMLSGLAKNIGPAPSAQPFIDPEEELARLAAEPIRVTNPVALLGRYLP